MAEYELNIEIPHAAKRIQYKANITGRYESYPEDFFKKAENRQKIREYIETQSQRIVSEKHLNEIVKEWIDDIKLGYSPTDITLDLPPQTGSSPPQNIPSSTLLSSSTKTHSQQIFSDSTPKAKQPNKGGQFQTTTPPTSNQGEQTTTVNLSNKDQVTSNPNSASQKNSPQTESKPKTKKGENKSEEPEEPISKVWSNTNQGDF